MSTDMAISLAKKFIRQISQPFDHTQTGISLWTLEDIEERQRKDQEESDRALRLLGSEAAAIASIETYGVDGVEGDVTIDYATDGMEGVEGANGTAEMNGIQEKADEDEEMAYDGGIDDEALLLAAEADDIA